MAPLRWCCCCWCDSGCVCKMKSCSKLCAEHTYVRANGRVSKWTNERTNEWTSEIVQRWRAIIWTWICVCYIVIHICEWPFAFCYCLMLFIGFIPITFTSHLIQVVRLRPNRRLNVHLHAQIIVIRRKGRRNLFKCINIYAIHSMQHAYRLIERSQWKSVDERYCMENYENKRNIREKIE